MALHTTHPNGSLVTNCLIVWVVGVQPKIPEV